MKKTILLLCCLVALTAQADKYFTKTAKVNFYSKAPLETIQAYNSAVGVLLNTSTGDLRFSMLIKSFVFEKKLMQEHFNENYLESDKHPKATFEGKLSNLSSINFAKDGKYAVTVSGNLTIHGVKKAVSEKGYIQIKNGAPTLLADFNVRLTDYKIKIPGAVKDKIAKDVKISVDASLKKL